MTHALATKPSMTPERTSQLQPMLRAFVFVAALTVALLASTAMASQASAFVAWESTTMWAPTNLQPGERGGLWVEIGNVGDEQAMDWPIVEVALPPGVTFSANDTAGGFGWSCSAAGDPQIVTCSSPFAAFFDFLWPKPNTYIGFGFPLPVSMTVNVAADAPVGPQELAVTVSGAGAADPVTSVTEVEVGGEVEGFGVVDGSFFSRAVDESGAPSTQAGAHPYAVTTGFVTTKKFNDAEVTGVWSELVEPVTGIKDVVVELPAGLAGNPLATPRCTKADVAARTCPSSTQVGVAEARNVAAPMQQMFAVYNVAPDSDAPAQFMFETGGGPVLLTPVLRSDGDWGLSIDAKDVTEANPLFATRIDIWGVPADPSHDYQRCAVPSHVGDRCAGYDAAGNSTERLETLTPSPANVPPRPFLTNPTRCNGSPELTTLRLSPWEDPAQRELDGDPLTSDLRWTADVASAPALTGCDKLSFVPTIDVRPTSSKPGASAGLSFKLAIPQNDDVEGLATAHMKDAVVVLPKGTTVNSGSAEGLASCSAAQIGLTSNAPVRFTKLEPSCPLESKLGTVEVDTPLLDAPLTGNVYLAAQDDNPFGSLVAMYFVVRGPGILGKLAARVDMNGDDGQITTTVVENPQLPFETLTLRLKGGDSAPLAMPASCGSHEVTSTFTSWGGQSASPSDSFDVDCPGNGDLFDPGFAAGTVSSTAGTSSPLHMRVTRDAGKELGRMQMSLPKGLLAAPRSVALCSEAALAGASARGGRSVQADASCPASSQIGTTTAGVGAGEPFFPLIPGTGSIGRVFLTGPHSGTDAPLPGGSQIAYGLAIEVPAVAGPFDLGTVLVRAAIYADPTTAELTVISDKLPRMLQGVPLNARDVRVDIDRAGFTRNPTSCHEQQIRAEISAQDGTVAHRSARFQAGECAGLRFKPRLGIRLAGRRQMTSERHPSVKAVVRQKAGEAGIEKVVVRLPKALALDPDNAQALCEHADGTKDELTCPKGSIVGRAKAVSPLLKAPLTGNVYFVKNIRKDPETGASIRTLPMLVVALRGEISVNLRGVSSVSGSRLVNTFANVPDAPISRFNLNLKGGKSGILVVTESAKGRIDLCSSRQIAQVDSDGHNGKRRDFDVRVKTACSRKQRRR